MTLHEYFLLYVSKDKFYIEPRQEAESIGECLTIDRLSHDFTLLKSASSIPAGLVPTPIYGIIGIIRLVAGPYIAVITEREEVGKINGHVIYSIKGTDLLPFAKTTLHLTESQVQANKLLVSMETAILNSSGNYFSTTYDITHTLQRLQNTSPEFLQMGLHERADERFLWNSHHIRDLSLRPELQKYTLPIMSGFMAVRHATINNQPVTFALISRRSCYRAGTRFYTRGLDSRGNAANFVESEQILQVGQILCSFVQVRGSIPLFWSQEPDLAWQPQPRLRTEDHIKGYKTHMESLALNYGHVYLVNLVNQKGREKRLSDALENVVNAAAMTSHVKYLAVDFHRECKIYGWNGFLENLLSRLEPDLLHMGYFATRQGSSGAGTRVQSGVFRTNCMDCLDRTNVVQALLAHRILEVQLQQLQILPGNEPLLSHEAFESSFKNVWADNADHVSVQYAGTGALKADFTRTGQRTNMGLINDGWNALSRYYKNNFLDGFRQDAIDLFIGNYVVESSDGPVSVLCAQPRDRRFMAIPMGFVAAFAMLILCLLFRSEILFICFWLVFAFALLGLIFRYGYEYVDRPKFKRD